MMFTKKEMDETPILTRLVKIRWQSEKEEKEIGLKWYRSKKELRITRFGKNFPYLSPDMTGSLFILVQDTVDDYEGFFLSNEDEIEYFLDSFGISSAETNCLLSTGRERIQKKEEAAVSAFIAGLSVEFPLSEEMSAAARRIQDSVYDHRDYIIKKPDEKLVDWTVMEYKLFRAVEEARYGKIISNGFSSMDAFVEMANTVLNRRKSRAGKSLEHHLSALFTENNLLYTAQAITEGRKKPDFLFPSEEAYHDPSFSTDRLITLAAKTTCKDRWRQILNEADRRKGRTKYLCTLQQGISEAQMKEMHAEKVVLVVPRQYIGMYPKPCREMIWTVKDFIDFVKEVEAN